MNWVIVSNLPDEDSLVSGSLSLCRHEFELHLELNTAAPNQSAGTSFYTQHLAVPEPLALVNKLRAAMLSANIPVPATPITGPLHAPPTLLRRPNTLS